MYLLNFPYLSLAPTNAPGLDGTRLVESSQNLGDTAVGDEKLPRDVTGSDPEQGELHNSPTDIVRQWSPVHKHSPQLIHSCLT